MWQEISTKPFHSLLAEVQGRHQRAEFVIFLVLASSILWLLNRPYTGIWHDAIIYSLLAARQLDPTSFSKELFFLFGSQDDVNLFTPAWAWLISLVGLEPANRVVVLLGGGMWCSSFAVLGRVFFGYALPTVFVTLLAATLSFSYSPNGATFILNETFATARVLSMPLVLLGISADLVGRWRLGMALCVVSTALHPLLGIWGLLLVLCRKWPRAWIVAGILAVFAFVFVIGPLLPIKLIQPMAHEWMNMVRHSSTDVFVEPDISLSFGKPLFWIFSLWLGVRFGQPRFSDLFAVTALMTATAYLLAYLCSNYYPVALVMQAQPWRVFWLATSIGLFALVDVVWQSVRKGAAERVLVGTGLLSIYAFLDWSALVLSVPCSMSILRCCESRTQVFLSLLKAHCGKAQAILSLAFLMILPSLLLDVEMSWVGIVNHRGLPRGDIFWGFVIVGGYGFGFLVWGSMALFSRPRRLCILFFVPVLAFAWGGWDQRSGVATELAETFLANGATTHLSSTPIAPGDVVAWPGHEMEVWFVMRGVNYATPTQAVGSVFSEDKAREAERRIKRLVVASMMDDPSIGNDPEVALREYQRRMLEKSLDVENIHEYAPGKVKGNGIRYLCSDITLDWVVSDQASDLSFDGLPVVKEISVRNTVYSFIRCADVRQSR